MKDGHGEQQPVGVLETAKQTGEIRDRWPWTEPCVWTERMLTALEQGVKGGKWFSLIDKVYNGNNLRRAFARVKANRGGAGVDYVSIKAYKSNLEVNLTRLERALRENRYRPQRIRRVWIPKPGTNKKRPLGVPTVQDRVVQTALRQVIEPIYERDFAEHSYGFRPQRGCKDALRRVVQLLESGYHYVVDADIEGYFDNIDKERLMELVSAKIADGRVLELIRKYLNQEVLEVMKAWRPEKGTPQGAVISPLLANIYLDPLDHLMAQLGYEMIRYADDIVVLCRTAEQAQQVLREMQRWMETMGLRLHTEKTRIVDAETPEGFDFLGYHFQQGRRWPSSKSWDKVREKIRQKTKRCNGRSLEGVIEEVNKTLRGWYEYFKHSYPYTFELMDGWVRMRLRSILRKRDGRKGPGNGPDHIKWPNAYFARRGLFSLSTPHAQTCQPARR